MTTFGQYGEKLPRGKTHSLGQGVTARTSTLLPSALQTLLPSGSPSSTQRGGSFPLHGDAETASPPRAVLFAGPWQVVGTSAAFFPTLTSSSFRRLSGCASRNRQS